MEHIHQEAWLPGKPAWHPMLRYVADLHQASTHPPQFPFPYPWEEIGPGYCYGPAFGHWDIVHAVLDVLPADPAHARMQILNHLAIQQPNGWLPALVWPRETETRWSDRLTSPPVWPVAVHDHAAWTGSDALIEECYAPLCRQIGWFESQRRSVEGGFYYLDILEQRWESGVDEGIRFLQAQPGPFACVDATAHVYAVYAYAADWSARLGRDAEPYAAQADVLRALIQERLYDEGSGFFYDIWAVQDPALRHVSFEGLWPVIVGAATPAQAMRAIDGYLLNPTHLFSAHPLATVSVSDPLFELRMWRGPAWNSMTYWAARGCMRYGRADAALRILERALDGSAAQFERTGTVWEFYHPHGGNPEDLARKPHTPYNTPCCDYLGHNPLNAMARLYDRAREEVDRSTAHP